MRALIRNFFTYCILTTAFLGVTAHSEVKYVYKSKQEYMRDANSQRYRMYYDAAISSKYKNKLMIKQFNGQLRLENLTAIFGNLMKLPEDAYGNRIGGWRNHKNKIWAVTIGPSLETINLVSIGKDGLVSSVFDLDGDGTADIVDTRLPDDSRFTFLTELLGMGVFELWLAGENPLCREQKLLGMHLPAFGCPEGSGGGSGGHEGGSSGPIYDHWDMLCGDYGGRGNGGLRPPVMAQVGDTGLPQRVREQSRSHESGEYDGITYSRSRQVYTDEHGNHSLTVTVTVYKDSTTGMTREITETVDNEGRGTREIVDNNPADDSTSVSYEEFETEVDENGEYDDGGHPRNHQDAPGNPGPSDTSGSSGGSHTNPGGRPGDPNQSMAEWCANQTPVVSGVEQAAAHDPSAFSVGCDDLVKQSYAAADCTIIDWAGLDDFRGIDAASAGTNCGPFEQPGPDGTCGAPSGLSRLLGNTAWIGSADLGTVEICDPKVCSPIPW